MKTKKVLTANLKPGMVSAENAYSFTNHLVIQSNTTLTEDIIEKLKYYTVRSLKVYQKEDEEEALQPAPSENPTYYERVQQTEQFTEFKGTFTDTVESFRTDLNLISTGTTKPVEHMLNEVNTLIGETRNPLNMMDMVHCLRKFDDMTYTHSLNVALICSVIGTWMNLSESDMNVLITAGLLHDIGKLTIPPEVISKPGKLTDEEFALIRSHPRKGYDILHGMDFDNRVKLAALQHHERYDGSGYPRHLAGGEINQFASIVAIADVYDAMTSERVYRERICPFTVISTFEHEQNLYDPEILYLFMKHIIEAYINTEVELSNGERGKVVLLNQNILSRPVVITETQTHDLSHETDLDIVAII